MKRTTFYLVICSIFLTIFASEGLSQAPLLREQLVYRWNAFNGKGYGGGFLPQSENTIYFMANHSNDISARKTLVYFWPITGKYMAGWKTINEEIEGTLEILKEGKIIKSLKKEDNVISYPGGYWGEEAIFYEGKEALAEHQKYKDALQAYYNALKEFYDAKMQYRKDLDQFFKEVKKRREAGEEGALDLEIPKEPKPPEGIQFYVTEPKKDYIVNLPLGRYQIRLRAKDNTIVEGSEKNIVTFTSRRTGGIGYQIIPGNKWTKQEPCNDPAKIIYGAGKNTLYFQPFIQDEYNELFYNKLQDPQNFARKEAWTWVHIKPIKDALLVFLKGNKVLSQVPYLPYLVKQIPGPELGYEVTDYDDEEAQGRKPTFEGHKLELLPQLATAGYKVQLREKGKNIAMSASERKIRLVRKENSWLLYLISIFPLIIGAIIFIRRRKKIT